MNKIVDSFLTLGKAALKSRPAGRSLRREKGGVLIIMGNGPSLRDTISQSLDTLRKYDTTAVNFAANAPEFKLINPTHYVLADPHFFGAPGRDPNVDRLWENLRDAGAEMTLHLPAGRNATLPPEIRLQHFNMTPGDGADALSRWLYRKGLAMPRPRNVLIPAVMEGIRDGYDEIYIVGADHTWPHTLYVDDLNRVVTVQPHFYEDNKKELDRVAEEYVGLRLHDVLGSMTVAFRSYHAVKKYAEKEGVKIYNSTPGSLIDAFIRKPLP